MLELHLQGRDFWDDEKEEFITLDGCDIRLEHSLVSISKWEAKYKKPYLTTEKTTEEVLDYIKMMVIGKPINDYHLCLLTKEQYQQIGDYINDSMTATVFSKEDEEELKKKNLSGKFVSSEEIYYWMTAQNIPFECQYWHINRLITLVRICAIKNKPDDKKKKRMTSAELQARRARMDAARKKFANKK